MKYYKMIKSFSRMILVFEIILCIFFAAFAFIKADIFNLFISICIVFIIVIPQYLVVLLLEKNQEIVDKNFENVIYRLDKMSKGEFNNNNNFNTIPADEAIPMFSKCISATEKIISEFEKNNKLLNEILISAAINKEVDVFFEEVIPKIMDVTKSGCCVFYITNKTTNKLEIKSSVGFGKSIYSQFDIALGEGFVGRAALENKIKIVKDIDDDSIFISKTFLGNIKPKNFILIPVNALDDENEVLGVLAAASIHEYDERLVDIFCKIRKYISYAIVNGTYYNKTQRLTNELKFQNQLIQNLNEDLEAKIKERTVFLNNIINSVNGYSIISIDISRKVTLFNDGAIERFGISREDILDKPIDKIPNIEKYIQDDKADYIENALRNGKSSHISKIRNKNSEFLFEVEMFDMSNKFDEVSGINIVIRDISYIKKLKLSVDFEKKMTEIMLEESSKAIIIIKEDSSIEDINKNAEYILGVNKDNAIGKRLWEFFNNEDDIYSFVESVFSEKLNASIDTTTINTSIDISMRSRILFDDSAGTKKALIYL